MIYWVEAVSYLVGGWLLVDTLVRLVRRPKPQRQHRR